MRSLLRSGRSELPFGAPTDSPEGDTVCGLDNSKTGLFMRVLDRNGVEVFEGTLAFLRAVRTMALETACVSSSPTRRMVLERTRLMNQFDVVYDGNDLEREGLTGKPQPDGFLKRAALLGVEPGKAADAVVGVTARSAARCRRRNRGSRSRGADDQSRVMPRRPTRKARFGCRVRHPVPL